MKTKKSFISIFLSGLANILSFKGYYAEEEIPLKGKFVRINYIVTDQAMV